MIQIGIQRKVEIIFTLSLVNLHLKYIFCSISNLISNLKPHKKKSEFLFMEFPLVQFYKNKISKNVKLDQIHELNLLTLHRNLLLVLSLLEFKLVSQVFFFEITTWNLKRNIALFFSWTYFISILYTAKYCYHILDLQKENTYILC